MKRSAIIISLLLACAQAFAGGIGSAADLQAFINACNKGQSLSQWYGTDTTVVLTADIDLAKAKKMPQVASFSGVFDGKGFRLKNWKATGGLFHEITKTGVVRGIVIDASCVMKVSSKGDEFRAGFIADFNDGIISDCINYGTIDHKCDFAMAPAYIGGIAGYNRYAITGCSNFGALTSYVSGEAKEETCLNLGGITGGSRGKAAVGSVVAHCNNYGKITAAGNLVAMFVGGIVGNSGKSTTKYCVNRGEVDVTMDATEDGKTAGIIREGGIAGLVKGDVLRCDNFGKVTAKGACGANVAGICGMPHDAVVVADCINFGPITGSGEQPSNVGGIAGNIGRPAHIRGCINNGKIVFDGVSSRARSTAGGIAGNIYSPKSQTAGAYVRECINKGEIYAGAGGNKYDATNRNAIHVAGIVAYADTREGLRAFVTDCSNFGKVGCAQGRKGEICASAVMVKTGGRAANDYAEVLASVPAGGNVTGTVRGSDGAPKEGIIVTDGRQCVKTDASGNFAMTSDLSEARFIYLSLPATAVIPGASGRAPIPFKRIPRYAKAVKADFTLDLGEPTKDYTVMMIADPQVRPYGVDNSMEAWDEVVAPDAEAFRASCTGPVYSINLGDLVYNFMNAWDDYMDVASKIKCPTFNVIGNHDYDQGTLFETEQGTVYFETYVGPDHYSFDLGDIHYVVFNNILYDRKGNTDKYHYGLDDRTLAWLQADLSFVPKDKIIMTCSHHNPFKTPNTSPHGSHNVYSLHYAEYLALISSFKAVYAWNGHNHENFYYNYKGKDTSHGAPNIQCISVARATGALRFNAPIAALGEPQGYMVMNVHGENIDWYYKSVGHGKDYQMRVYGPSRSSDGTIRVNVWNWSEGWSTPSWYEDGVKIADMEYKPGVDPDYYDLYGTITNKTTRKYCKPSNKAHIFAVTPSAGAKGGEVRVTDMFGNEYKQSIIF
jgi:hypothetical protein